MCRNAEGPCTSLAVPAAPGAGTGGTGRFGRDGAALPGFRSSGLALRYEPAAVPSLRRRRIAPRPDGAAIPHGIRVPCRSPSSTVSFSPLTCAAQIRTWPRTRAGSSTPRRTRSACTWFRRTRHRVRQLPSLRRRCLFCAGRHRQAADGGTGPITGRLELLGSDCQVRTKYLYMLSNIGIMYRWRVGEERRSTRSGRYSARAGACCACRRLSAWG